MAGTKEGSKKAVATILRKNPDHFKQIGAIGGKAPSRYPKGFAANPELASRAGRMGGLKSRRNKTSK